VNEACWLACLMLFHKHSHSGRFPDPQMKAVDGVNMDFCSSTTVSSSSSCKQSSPVLQAGRLSEELFMVVVFACFLAK
jgi:hypothetical protein